mmetsp:Transcript_65772/g.113062  ORF Transcript_65772/g.113062 Transcript_65772/m.113062 type:complete len:201 (-) Transcript_65772:413-1015(-)
MVREKDLPYGGDANIAQRRGDRGAIRKIFKWRQRREDSKSKVKGNGMPPLVGGSGGASETDSDQNSASSDDGRDDQPPPLEDIHPRGADAAPAAAAAAAAVAAAASLGAASCPLTALEAFRLTLSRTPGPASDASMRTSIICSEVFRNIIVLSTVKITLPRWFTSVHPNVKMQFRPSCVSRLLFSTNERVKVSRAKAGQW